MDEIFRPKEYKHKLGGYKHKLLYILSTRDPPHTYRLKVRGWDKVFDTNGNQRKAAVAILTSDKIDFKTKTVKRDKEGHYIMIKDSIQ